MATKAQKEKIAADEKARRGALTQEERDAEDAAAAPAASKKSSKTSVSVQFNGGVREYSKEVHGDDFESLAKQFADKHKGTIL